MLPLSAQDIHEYLGHDGQLFGRQYTEVISDARGEHLTLRYDGSGATGVWQAGELSPGQSLREPRALFIKLDEGVVEEELVRMSAR